MQLRSREMMIVLVSTAIPCATTIIVLIVLASFFLPAAALGGSAFVAVVGFAAQRFLMDVMAGILIAFERWYAVGDFVMIGLAGRRAKGAVAQGVAACGADCVHAGRRNLVALRAPRSDQVMRVTARCPRLGVNSERGGYC
jgi:hypothetical protein